MRKKHLSETYHDRSLLEFIYFFFTMNRFRTDRMTSKIKLNNKQLIWLSPGIVVAHWIIFFYWNFIYVHVLFFVSLFLLFVWGSFADILHFFFLLHSLFVLCWFVCFFFFFFLYLDFAYVWLAFNGLAFAHNPDQWQPRPFRLVYLKTKSLVFMTEVEREDEMKKTQHFFFAFDAHFSMLDLIRLQLYAGFHTHLYFFSWKKKRNTII